MKSQFTGYSDSFVYFVNIIEVMLNTVHMGFPNPYELQESWEYSFLKVFTYNKKLTLKGLNLSREGVHFFVEHLTL